MKSMAPLVMVACLVGGCARFSTTQKDLLYENGEVRQAKTTHATSYTLFSSKSSLASWKAQQTDKTQGATVGDLNQQGATNASAAFEAIGKVADAARAALGQ